MNVNHDSLLNVSISPRPHSSYSISMYNRNNNAIWFQVHISVMTRLELLVTTLNLTRFWIHHNSHCCIRFIPGQMSYYVSLVVISSIGQYNMLYLYDYTLDWYTFVICLQYNLHIRSIYLYTYRWAIGECFIRFIRNTLKHGRQINVSDIDNYWWSNCRSVLVLIFE